jgi:FkbM family methyltransferase
VDALIWIRKSLSPTVDRLRLRSLARNIYRRLLWLRYGANGLALTRQNDRTWKLHHEVALRGEFQEFDTVLWLRGVIRPGDCVLDIGANVGQMTLEAAVLTGPTGIVVAIEPAPGNLNLLKRHITENAFADRVRVVEAACGARHGVTTSFYFVGNDRTTVGSGHSTNEQAVSSQSTLTSESIPLVSIDGLCREFGLTPNVIKIDVEGGELEVLRGAREVLRTCQPHVLFGFHPFGFVDPAHATREIRELLNHCGYNTPEPETIGAYNFSEYEAIPSRAVRR